MIRSILTKSSSLAKRRGVVGAMALPSSSARALLSTTPVAMMKATTDAESQYSSFVTSAAAAAAAALATATFASSYLNDNNNNSTNTTSCSGILAVVDSDGSSKDFFLDGLRVLQHRGYDGVGMASIDPTNKSIYISKQASTNRNQNEIIYLVHQHFEDDEKSKNKQAAHIATPKTTTTTTEEGKSVIVTQRRKSDDRKAATTRMVHTRWATHGAKSENENAHPHTDSTGKIAIVHNGTLTNGRELRRLVEDKFGYKLSSQTDSEVIAKLIGHFYNAAAPETASIKDATEKALALCDGTWGLCVMYEDAPHEMVVACNGSPLYIGIGDGKTFVSSDLAAFHKYTKNYIIMRDGEIGVINANGETSLDLTRAEVEDAEKALELQEQLRPSPDPYPTWALKEIMEQPEAIARGLGFGARLSFDRVTLGGIDTKANLLKDVEHIYLAACGSSLNASRYAERLMRQIRSVDGRIASLDAAETDMDDVMSLPPKSLVVGVSQSGETKATHRVLDDALGNNINVMSVVNTVGSLIARTTKLGVYCHAGHERAVPSTKTFTAETTILALVALWFRELQNHKGGNNTDMDTENLRESLMRLPISFGMALKSHDQCKRIAERLNDKEHCFVLGKGYAEPIAFEGALKLKEMGYLHAEGYSGGALKHGPFALIENAQNGKFGATPIIMIILDDEHGSHMRTAAEEVKARGAELIIITDKPSLARDLDPNPIIIPSNGPMTALSAIVPIQLLAYEMAMLRGNDPDAPRNLAKYF